MYVPVFILIVILVYLLTAKYRIYNRYKSRFNFIKNTNDLPVDMVYCISMPNRIEYAPDQMNRLGTSYTLFNAISPKDVSRLDYLTMMIRTYLPWNTRYFKKMTRLPVALSFFMCYYDAYLNGYDSICIFEDDIHFPHGKDKLVPTLNEWKDSDADVLFLGYCHLKCRGEFTEISENLMKVPNSHNIACNHGLGMKKEFIYRYAIRNPFLFWATTNDRDLSSYMQRNNTSKAIPKRAIVYQNVSELGSNNEHKNTNIDKNLCIF